MRYREGQTPDPSTPYGADMHAMLTLSAVIGIVAGAVLFALARRGPGSLWLAVWSALLVLSSVAYLAADALGLRVARI